MALAAIEEKKLTEFAEHVYKEQKEVFVKDLAQRIKKSIDTGMTQIENGEFISLEESKRRIYSEFFNKPVNE